MGNAHTFFVGEDGVLVHNSYSEGAGGNFDKLTQNEIRRIQNAANKINDVITVAGSRVNPNKCLHPNSDWDYVINANSKKRRRATSSLPGAKDIKNGVPNTTDVFKGDVDKTRPYVTVYPD